MPDPASQGRGCRGASRDPDAHAHAQAIMRWSIMNPTPETRNPKTKTLNQAILRWSIAQTDTTAPSDAKPMDPEKRAFLEKVMAEMVEDESKSMKDLVEAIKGPEDTLEQARAKQEALEEAIDRCDKIDYAVGFHSFANGLFPTIDLLETSEHGQLYLTSPLCKP